MAFAIEGPERIQVECGSWIEVNYRVVAALSVFEVNLIVTGLPHGVNASFTPCAGEPPFYATLFIESAANSDQGDFVLNITAWDDNSSKTMPVVLSNFPVISETLPPTVTTNASSYAGGATITVTVNHGHFDLHEWVGIFETDDFGAITENIWVYIATDTKTLPGAAVSSYPVTCHLIAPSVAGTYHVAYFGTDDNSMRLAYSANFTAFPASTFTPDYYASPAGSGTNPGTLASPFRISDFWAHAAPGISLGLISGTYTGIDNMIQPPNDTSGEVGAPILIKAITDGGVVIDGQGAREPVRLKGIDYMTLEGFDARNSSDAVVVIGGGTTNTCSNITCRRIVAYDAALSYQAHIWILWNCGANILLEDCAGFGVGRYVLNWFQSRDPANLVVRRFWGRWMRQTDSPLSGGPKGINLSYDADNVIAENVFATWDETENSGPPIDGYGALWSAGNTPPCLNAKFYGCMSYLRAADAEDTTYTVGLFNVFGSVLGSTVEHCIAYVEPGSHTGIKGFMLDDYSSADPARFATRCTSINSTANTVTSQWVQSNNNFNQSSVPSGAVNNIWNGSANTGARIYYRYLNGSLTSVPLWPWPMDSRIAAAITASGRSLTTFFGSGNTGLTDLMTDIFGAIP